MTFPSAFSQKCSCGRVFLHAGAFKNHQNTCKKSKSHLSSALAKAKEILSSKKRQVAPVAADLLVEHEVPEAHHDVQVKRMPLMLSAG